MAEQKLIEQIARYLTNQFIGNPDNFPPDECLDEAIFIWNMFKEVYPIMYREEAEWVGWLLKQGWIPPAEAKNRVKQAGGK